MKIGIYGSAAGEISEIVVGKAQQIGELIAKANCTLITGGCNGIPQEVVIGAQKSGGQSIAYSPCLNLEQHKKTDLPTEGFTDFVFIPNDYKHAQNPSICKKYRNLASVSEVDAAIFIGGRIGTMNEFTIAYDIGKPIGVLTGTGGITERALQILIEDSNKPSSAKVIFSDDPSELIKLLLTD